MNYSKQEIYDLFTEAIKNELPTLIEEIIQREMGKQTLTTAQVRDQYGISRKQQHDLRKKRKVSFIQDGRKILYRRTAIEDYLNEYSVQR